MARPLRIEFPGTLYHVTSRRNERGTVFRDDEDRNRRPDRPELATYLPLELTEYHAARDEAI
jgi:hypothetical protein